MNISTYYIYIFMYLCVSVYIPQREIIPMSRNAVGWLERENESECDRWMDVNKCQIYLWNSNEWSGWKNWKRENQIGYLLYVYRLLCSNMYILRFLWSNVCMSCYIKWTKNWIKLCIYNFMCMYYPSINMYTYLHLYCVSLQSNIIPPTVCLCVLPHLPKLFIMSNF